MNPLESIYNSILLENQNPNNIDLKLLKKCVVGTYNINDDGSVDVDGDVDLDDVYLNSENLTKIPFKFRNVSGYFTCINNKLTSLEGAPNTVGRWFSCTNNQLTSLEGAPNTVGGIFSCSYNQLTSLEGAPSSVGGAFCCYGNNPTLPYSELFKIVDNVKGDIYSSGATTPEDKDKIRRDRDVKTVLKDDELGDLDV